MSRELIGVFCLGMALGAFIMAIGWVSDNLRASRRELLAFKEGRDIAIDNAAMVAYSMGHSDVRDAINALVDGQRIHERLEFKQQQAVRS